MSIACKKLLLAVLPQVPKEKLLRAREALEDAGYQVDFVTVSSYSPEDLLMLEKQCKPPRCCIIVPGSTRFDYSRLTSIRVLKGTYTLDALPLVVGKYGVEALDPSIPAEKALGPLMADIVFSLYCRLSTAAQLVPDSPPPLKVISEVYVDGFRDVGDAVDEVSTRFDMGADIVVLATRSTTQFSNEVLKKTLKEANSMGLGPLGIDPADRSMLPRLASSVDLIMSLTTSEALKAAWTRKAESYIVILEPRGSKAMINACRQLRSTGLRPIIDPVVLPNPRALKSFSELAAARSEGLECPALLGINNVYELLDADTTGSIAALTMLAAEAGASAILVSEESGKSAGATVEAKIASIMASYSLYTGAPPKDLGLDLLTVKCKNYSAPAGRKKLEAASRGEACLENVRGLLRQWPCREGKIDI